LPFVFGWAGMRGVVSLAAALSIPFVLPGGADFPQRDLIIFITFVVIVLTLLVQGLTLPALIRKLKLGDDPDYTLSPEERDLQLRTQLTGFSLDYLNQHYPDEVKKNPLLHQLCSRFYTDKDQLQHQGPDVQTEYREIYLQLLKKQRKYLNKLNGSLENDEEIIRKYQTILDLEQEKLAVLYDAHD
jgi:NhaP-type Na+/H+ or K+/H+ antiporter